MHCTCTLQDYEEEYESRELNGVENDTVQIDTLKAIADVNDEDVPQEIVRIWTAVLAGALTAVTRWSNGWRLRTVETVTGMRGGRRKCLDSSV